MVVLRFDFLFPCLSALWINPLLKIPASQHFGFLYIGQNQPGLVTKHLDKNFQIFFPWNIWSKFLCIKVLHGKLILENPICSFLSLETLHDCSMLRALRSPASKNPFHFYLTHHFSTFSIFQIGHCTGANDRYASCFPSQWEKRHSLSISKMESNTYCNTYISRENPLLFWTCFLLFFRSWYSGCCLCPLTSTYWTGGLQ